MQPTACSAPKATCRYRCTIAHFVSPPCNPSNLLSIHALSSRSFAVHPFPKARFLPPSAATGLISHSSTSVRQQQPCLFSFLSPLTHKAMASFDAYSTCLPQIRRPKESLLSSLRARELGVHRGKSHAVVSRRMYRSVYPNTTIHGVDCLSSYLKKFTPCGQVCNRWLV